MPKSKSTYPEIEGIKQDIDSLKTNVVELTRHIKEDGMEQSEELKEAMKSRLFDIRAAGQDKLEKLENEVKSNPGRSVAIAFAGGLMASYLLRRR